ncbi:MAG TPA: 2-dehydropantoate 2-reductase, partial [Rhizomicrobium sp.]
LGVLLAKSGNSVSVLAHGETLAAIKRDGLVLTIGGETLNAAVTASSSAKDLGPQDLIVVAVKGPALGAVAPAIAAMLGPQTIVLPAMNGVPWWFTGGLEGPAANMTLHSVDPGGTIAAAIPPSHVIGCVVHASASTAAPGHSLHTAGKRLIIGEPGNAITERLARVAGLLSDAGLDAVQTPHIRQDIWYKLWGNMTMNPISALTRATTDRILDDPLVAAFALAVMNEAKTLGARIGCHIGESGEDRMKVTRRLGAIKTSMLQDVEAGRALELDALLAAPREIAGTIGLATPNMDALHGLARLMAAKA